MSEKLRVVIADDERPARSFLAAALRGFPDVEIVGEASNGAKAIELIETSRPDIALLDLQMPELDGLAVVKLLRKTRMPLVIFVTAHDEYAVQAFELNAVDYLLKPVEPARLREALNRAFQRLERADVLDEQQNRLRAAAAAYEARARSSTRIDRIPVRRRNDIVLVPVKQIASIVADGELLHIRTADNESYTISYRLRDLAAKFDPARFIRLGRGTIVNLELIRRIVPMPGGTYTVHLANQQEFRVSRIQSRFLREQLLRL
jgi:two-component system LytT family response regulator